MKPLRVLLISAGVVVVVVAIVLALAFNAGVQTWAARRALAAQPDLQGEIGRLSVGLQAVHGEDLVLRKPGLRLTLPEFDAELAVWDALRERIDVRRLVAKGWTLDLTAPESFAGASDGRRSQAGVLPGVLAAAARGESAVVNSTEAATDLLAALALPIELIALDGVQLEGEVIFPAAGGTERAKVTLTGGGLSATSEGSFQLRATSAPTASDAAVSALQLDSRIVARMSTARTFAWLSANSRIDARGPRFPDGVQLRVDATAGAEAGGSSVYALDLRRGEKLLLEVDAQPDSREPARLAGTWRVAVTAEDLAPFAFGFTLPRFEATGEGPIGYSAVDEGLSAAGNVDVSADGLDALHPGMAAVGALTAHVEFEARRAGDDVRITRLRTAVSGARPVLELQTRQGLEFNLSTGELRVADPDADLLDLQVHGLPLAWLPPLGDKWTLQGGPLQGAWTAAARDGGFSLRASAPLTAGGVQVLEGGQPVAQALDLALSLSGEYLPSGWQARVENGHVRSGSKRLVSFDARAGRASAAGAALVATSRFNADVGGWLAQPAAAEYRLVQSGTAVGEFIVALSEKVELAAELELANLIGAAGEQLPDAALDIRADVAADGRIEAHAPLRVTRDGRASDVTLDAQVRPQGDGYHLDAVASGRHVFMEDLQLLLLPLAARSGAGAGGAAAAPAPEQPGGTPPGPVWRGLEGKLALSFGTVVYSEQLSVANVTGEVVLGADALRVPQFQAVLPTGGEMSFEGGLEFDAQEREPYAIQGQVAATGVEVGGLMGALSPGATPPVEGKFDLTSTVSGRAPDLASLAEHVAGDAKLSSRGGTLRALSVTVADYAKTASALGNVAGLIGSLTGDSRGQRIKAAVDLADQLANLNFDQLNIEITRSPGSEITVKDLSLISPAIRLLGSGTVGDQPGRPLWQEPLNLRLQLSAREGVAQNLKTLRLLSETADSLGYLPMVEELTLQGSLANISRAQLQSLISRALSQ